MLEIKDFSVAARDSAVLLDGISLSVAVGTAVGLTGQSGAGKTTLLKSILGMLDRQCDITSGEIIVDGSSLYALSQKQRRGLCGTTLGFIPQNPMTAFDSRVKIKNQMLETLQLRAGLSVLEAQKISMELLSDLGLDHPERVMESYPPQLSGGMLQRVTVALLLALNPKYILADEPTSALDEENRALLLEQLEKRKNVSGILFISHDVEALYRLCDVVYVIEQGQLIESGTMESIMTQPQRDWTRAFSAAAKCNDQEVWTWTD